MSNQSLAVLIIEDNSEFVQLVRHWLVTSQESSEVHLVSADSVMAGLHRLEKGGVDVILLDLGLPDSDGFETFSRIKAHNDIAPIIILSAGDDEALALQMVQNGAQDYLVKSSCNGEILRKAIRYAVVRQAGQTASTGASEQAIVIGVIGAKGGVGATTFACNLAAELHGQTNQRALLADLDVDAGLAGFLANVQSHHSILDAIANIHRLDHSCWNGIVNHGCSDMEILHSPCLLGRGSLDLVEVRSVLAAIQPFYRWIVLDLGRLSELTVGLLDQTDEVYLFTTTQVSALYEAKRVVDRLKDLGFALERLRLIVNRLDNTPAIHHNDLDRVFGIPVYLRLSDASQELENACTAGKLPDKNGDFRRQIASLARKIGGLAEEIPKRKRTPLFAFGKG